MTAVDRITYQQTFPTGAYANVKLGIEMSLVPGVDDVQEAFKQAKEIVNEAFTSMNPHLSTPSAEYSSEIKQEIPKEINLEAERVAILIENAETSDELTEYFNKAVEHHLQDEYEKRLKELS